uniref:Uncharacterized protein n=1 Tax=Alexandrium andersonii TaxID=327968 RepID=A0A7S2AFL5_9DINO|mmetsp:Transcript_1097/g.2365  ORF Transcript_1097/g.2365 Transcript_1097/m.2365 type:complete len:210 (+) Transcript_1097:73-702(+)
MASSFSMIGCDCACPSGVPDVDTFEVMRQVSDASVFAAVASQVADDRLVTKMGDAWEAAHRTQKLREVRAGQMPACPSSQAPRYEKDPALQIAPRVNSRPSPPAQETATPTRPHTCFDREREIIVAEFFLQHGPGGMGDVAAEPTCQASEKDADLNKDKLMDAEAVGSASQRSPAKAQHLRGMARLPATPLSRRRAQPPTICQRGGPPI